MTANHFTVGDLAALFGLPEWRIRRAVDNLDAEIPRVGRYRLIPRDLLTKLGAELERRRQARPFIPSELAPA